MSIKVLVYDDNEALRHSIETLLKEEHGIEFIAGISNAETVETDINQLQPDVILMDIDMPRVNGAEAVKRIRKIKPDIPVLMLTVFDDNENIFKAVCAGASGYLLKRYAEQELAAAIHSVVSGGAPMTGTVAKKVLQMVPQRKIQMRKKQILPKKKSSFFNTWFKAIVIK